MNIEIKISKKPVEYTKAIAFLEKRLLKLKNLKASDIAEYYFGGKERVTWLRTLWKILYAYGFQNNVFVD